MNHGLTNSFLYSACKIVATFEDPCIGIQKLTGTCFFTVNKYEQVCLVTNRHMVEYPYKRPEPAAKDYRLTGVVVENHSFNALTSLPDIVTELNIKNFARFDYSEDKENDIACLVGVEAMESIEIAFSIPHNWIAGKSFFDNSLQVCDFLAFPGFPDWHDKLNNSAIFRNGTVASDPRFNYSNQVSYMGERVAYEAFSFGGSSGSPVFALQQGFPVSGAIQMDKNFYRPPKLIGINGGHLLKDEKQHSGISYFYKSSAILSILDADPMA